MSQILNCLSLEFDWRLLALAGIACCAAAFVAIHLFRRARLASRVQVARLDAALNNMSQALCMFDSERRLIVCNGNYARLFSLPLELTRAGTPIEEIVDHRIALGLFAGEDAGAYKRDRLAVAVNDVPSKTLLEFRDGRIFSVAHQPMAEGGWVATHEDITEQVRAQRELKRLHATLEKLRSQLDRLSGGE